MFISVLFVRERSHFCVHLGNAVQYISVKSTDGGAPRVTNLTNGIQDIGFRDAHFIDIYEKIFLLNFLHTDKNYKILVMSKASLGS